MATSSADRAGQFGADTYWNCACGEDDIPADRRCPWCLLNRESGERDAD